MTPAADRTPAPTDAVRTPEPAGSTPEASGAEYGPSFAGDSDSFGRLLGHSGLSQPANQSTRVALLRRAQQTHGNQFVQRALRAAPSRIVQRECACGGSCPKCAAGATASAAGAGHAEEAEEHRAIQMKSSAGGETGAAPDVDLFPAGGEPLDRTTRGRMESHFGADLGDVRVHADSRAAEAAQSIQADAYTSGRDIYFGAGKYSPGTAEGQSLIAHEVTHVQQQAAGQGPSEVQASRGGRALLGAADDPLEHQADAQADRYADAQPAGGSVSPDSSGAVRRSPWNSVTDNPIANTLASGARRGASYVVSKIESVAPGAVAFFRNTRDYFKNAIGRGVDGLFGGLVGSLREKGLVGTLEGMVGGFAAGAVQAVGGFAAGQCAALGQLAEYLLDLGAKLGGGILDQARKGFEAIRGPLESLWTEYGAPAIDWVKKKLSGMWADATKAVKAFWDLLRPLREAADLIWNEVTDFLVESRRGFNDWLDALVPKALDAWEEIKGRLKPYMEHVKTAAKVAAAAAVLLSPAGPFVIVAGVVYGVYLGVKTLWEGWGQAKVRQLREKWTKSILPGLESKLKDFRLKVEGLKQKIQAGLDQLSDAFLKVLGALGVLSFLETVRGILNAVNTKIQAFKEKLVHQIDQWSHQLQALVATADPYLQQIKEVLRQTLLIAAFGPFAFLDDGVWNTMKRIVTLVMRTPCLRELGGLVRLPALFVKLGGYRDGMKQGWEIVKNPGPIMEQLKIAIAPLIAKVEPEVRAKVASLTENQTEREAMIQASILHYLGESFSELRQNWWPQLKKMGADLLWPWDEVGKNFLPMLHDFGGAISAVFDLEFSRATDQFLDGMKKFNGMAGALVGWFTVASVLIGGALGAFGLVFGPVGGATIGAGALAGFEFAEGVGMALLGIAAATEGAVMEKASIDLRFLNPRIADETERFKKDQNDCKKIGESVISLVTMGALMLLGALASKLAKLFQAIVKATPILRDIAEMVGNVKKSIADIGPGEVRNAPRPGGPHAEPRGPGEPPANAEPHSPAEEPGKAAESPGEPDAAAREGVVEERTPDGEHEIKVNENGDIIRCSSSCAKLKVEFEHELGELPNERFQLNEIEGRAKSPDPNVRQQAARDAARMEQRLREYRAANEPMEAPKAEPTEKPAEASDADAAAEKKAATEQDLADLKAKKAAAEAQRNAYEQKAKAEAARAKQLRDRAPLDKTGETGRQALEAEKSAADARKSAEQYRQETIEAQKDVQHKEWELNTDERSRICFAAGTPVWTPHGPRPIETLAVNDLVLAYDFATHTQVPRRVLDVFTNRTVRFYRVAADGSTILTTGRHRFWVESSNDWVEARSLQTGMTLRTVTGAVRPIDEISLHESPEAATWNLRVEECCTYYVGSGVLVHNAGGPAYNFGTLRIYHGTNPKFPGKVYVGQTDNIKGREAQHRAEAAKNLEKGNLTAEEREFWEFKRDMVLEEQVSGLNPDQANYLEQKNIDLSRDGLGPDNVMNRRDQVSESNMKELEQRIKSDPAVKEAKLCQ